MMDMVADFQVQRPLARARGPWSAFEATSTDGRHAGPVTLWLAPPEAVDDPAVARPVERLRALWEHAAVADAPLVTPLAAGRDGERRFVAWRAPAEPTLADRLREGPLTARETTRLVGRIAQALDLLRDHDVPHPPPAPQRIVLPGGRVADACLDDYGIASPPAPVCTDPELLADADWLAPEVARGDEPSAPADVYGLACVLVACLTGAPPFAAERPLLVLHAHAAHPRPHVAEHAGLPAAVDDVVRRGLHKEPGRRPASATVLARLLRSALQPAADPTAAALAPPPTAMPAMAGAAAAPSRRWRSPSRATATVLTVAALAGVTTALATSSAPERAASPAPAAGATPPAYARGVAQVRGRLEARRARARRTLHDATTATSQARAADALAAAYGAARDDAVTAVPGDVTTLDTALARAESAYRRLASAARRGDPQAFRSASAAIVVRERRVGAAFRSPR